MGSMTPEQENNEKLIRQPYHLAEASSTDTAKFMSLFSIITNLLHFGVTIVGLDYGHTGQMMTSEVTSGSPYGAATIAGGDGSRMPPENELAGARYQGRRIADVVAKLHG
jgi:multimeric flavodoxin WrbA